MATNHLPMDHQSNTAIVLCSLVCLVAVSRVVKFTNGLKAVSYLPGIRTLFQPLDAPGAIIPSYWWNPGIAFTYLRRFEIYRRYKSETISVVPILIGKPALYTSNLDVVRQVNMGGNKSSFIKPESAGKALLVWGMNLVVAEGDVWRKHRRIVGPAFNNELYAMVATKSAEVYHDMVEVEGWKNQNANVLVLQKFTSKFALLVIEACGFGFPFTWKEPAIASQGNVSVQEALDIVANSSLFLVGAPQWLWNLPLNSIKKIKDSHEALTRFMKEQVSERRAHLRDDANDVFSNLVRANEIETGKLRMDDSELIGNVFVMLFAGHDTTAHTLAATLALLSLERYRHIQEDVYSQIIDVLGETRDPTLDDYPKLFKVLSVFYEASRMFPAGYVMIREATEDTILTIPNPVGQEGSTTIPIPKGLQVVVDMVGVQNNPRYFSNPEIFDPSRWHNERGESSDALSAFSVGPRVCVGRKFATVESVVFLSLLIRDYKVVPYLQNGESEKDWEKRVIQANILITLGLCDTPLSFVKRK